VPGPIGFSTKIWSWVLSVSCQVIHGPGLLPATVVPPATDGFSASWSVWMFSEGTSTLPPPMPRPCPANRHLPDEASNRLAKMLLLPNPVPVVFSYQVAHGTVRPAPAKSIAGASPSTDWSKFSEPVKVDDALDRPPTVPLPRVVHAPAANERENTWS
jgi:hypothetical protein